MVVVVVPGKEALTKGPCVLDGAESVGELGPVLESLELALRVWVVVRDMRSAMGFSHAQISQHQRHRFGGHEVPRSAWMVRVPATMDCFSQVAAISRLANSAVSRPATIQPTTLRLKMSRMT